MKIYQVGGAVRDDLLGRAVHDRDYVVVGSTPQAMLDAGYKPVGRDFPVFLHPQTRAEYALARTERKSGVGYQGFTFFADPTTTLEEDLARRDLTINAMARGDDGLLVDPFGGARDLSDKVLRHVSPAFAEDPLRVLRLARFAARFADFSVAKETVLLARSLVGELSTLSQERVWAELARGLMEAVPSRMFSVLRDCGALAVLLPELDRLWGVPQRADYHPEVDTGVHVMQCLDYAANAGFALETRYAVLTHDLGKGLTPARILPAHHGHEAASVRLVDQVNARFKVPRACAELARVVAAEHGLVHTCTQLRPKTLVELLGRFDALRRPERFAMILDACESDKMSRSNAPPVYLARDFLESAVTKLRSVDAAQIAAAVAPERVAEAIRRARVRALTG